MQVSLEVRLGVRQEGSQLLRILHVTVGFELSTNVHADDAPVIPTHKVRKCVLTVTLVEQLDVCLMRSTVGRHDDLGALG